MSDLLTQQAYQKALVYLARREHSRLELRQKLARKGFTADIIDQVLTRLQTNYLINEARFIESFIRQRINKGCGPMRIQAELRQRGIDGERLTELLDVDAPEWLARACQVRQKRFGSDIPKDSRDRAKQVYFLQYRGFTHDQIKRALQKNPKSE